MTSFNDVTGKFGLVTLSIFCLNINLLLMMSQAIRVLHIQAFKRNKLPSSNNDVIESFRTRINCLFDNKNSDVKQLIN